MRPSASTLLVWTGAPCVYGCAHCPIAAAAAPPGVESTELLRRLQALPQVDGRLVVLIGGEPLLRRDCLRLIATVRAAGAVPGLVTTGQALQMPLLREKLRRAGLGYLRVQIFGCDDAHDRAAAVPGAYRAVIDGLRAWLAADGPPCDVDVCIDAPAVGDDALAECVRQVAADVGDDGVQIVIAAGASLATARSLAELAGWNDDAARPVLVWEGLPEAESPATCSAVPDLRRSFLGATPDASCLGDSRPAAAAARAPRSNSFNFVRTAATVAYSPTAVACAAHAAGGGAGERGRQLWLIDGADLVLHTTDTADFDAGAIAGIKDRWSHLFLDRAAPGHLDDFVEGMRRVVPDPVCETCPQEPGCARRFTVVDEPPFAREEAWIAAYMRQLHGRVLDVGCGEQLYRDEIIPLVRSGAVSYTGLDPDRQSLDDWRAVLPEGRFILGGIEDYAAPPASYERILCLRSLNHVFELDEAMARMASLLKPGGELLVVETTPFAMLRTPDQVAAADRAPRGGHQHYRNVTSEDVLPYARRRHLRVAHHHAVGRQGSNEWILLLTRG